MSQIVNEKALTFWDHLDELRGCLIKIAIVTILFSLLAFFFKDVLFTIVFAPKSADFITYRFFNLLVDNLPNFSVNLINTELSQQFMSHLKVSLYMGALCASPYIIYVLFHFIAPALYSNEKKNSMKAIGGGYILFVLGILLNYFLVFPLVFRFLGTYQVQADVVNLISLESYINTFLLLSLIFGVVFEIPVFCWILAKIGVLKSLFMRKYRRHAIVAIVIVAAIITPTADAFTLVLVALPIYLLYEFSIFVVKKY